MASRVTVYEGFGVPRRHRRHQGQQVKFKKAAKKCKGLKIRGFRACMREALKKHSQ